MEFTRFKVDNVISIRISFDLLWLRLECNGLFKHELIFT